MILQIRGKKKMADLTKREKENLEILEIASKVVVAEDIELLKELAKH